MSIILRVDGLLGKMADTVYGGQVTVNTPTTAMMEAAGLKSGAAVVQFQTPKVAWYVVIRTGEVSEGQLPRKAAAIVKEWCLAHQQEFLANWEHAERFEPMERIAGADQDD